MANGVGREGPGGGRDDCPGRPRGGGVRADRVTNTPYDNARARPGKTPIDRMCPPGRPSPGMTVDSWGCSRPRIAGTSGWRGPAVLRNPGPGPEGRTQPRGCGVPQPPATPGTPQKTLVTPSLTT